MLRFKLQPWLTDKQYWFHHKTLRQAEINQKLLKPQRFSKYICSNPKCFVHANQCIKVITRCTLDFSTSGDDDLHRGIVLVQSAPWNQRTSNCPRQKRKFLSSSSPPHSENDGDLSTGNCSGKTKHGLWCATSAVRQRRLSCRHGYCGPGPGWTQPWFLHLSGQHLYPEHKRISSDFWPHKKNSTRQ